MAAEAGAAVAAAGVVAAAETVVEALLPCRTFPLADLLVCYGKEETFWDLSMGSLMLIPYSFVPYIALSLTGGYFLLHRTSFSVLVGVFIAGLAVLNEGILKNLIRQPRPEGSCACGFGMPSGHAAITMGLLVWLSLELLLNNWNPTVIVRWRNKGKLMLLGLLLLVLLPTGYSRVRFRYHTWEQVAAGSIVGGVVAVIYYCFLAFFLSHHLDTIIKWKLIRWLSIKNQYPPRRRSSALLLPLHSNGSKYDNNYSSSFSSPSSSSSYSFSSSPSMSSSTRFSPELYFSGVKTV